MPNHEHAQGDWIEYRREFERMLVTVDTLEKEVSSHRAELIAIKIKVAFFGGLAGTIGAGLIHWVMTLLPHTK